MTDTEFWRLISLLDWAMTGDDDAVVEPVVADLAKHSDEDIRGFEDLLSEKLFALDTERHAREIGEGAYSGTDRSFSVDWLLYVRCCVIANGQDLYDAVLADPTEMPKDMEFEALYIAPKAYERKTGKTFDHSSRVSYETFSNREGWGRPPTS